MNRKELIDEFGELIYMIGRKDVLIKDKKKMELSKNDVIIIRSIQKLGNGKPIKMNAISHHFSISASAVSQYMKRFEQNGYIERILLDDDRRSVYVKLTAKAEAISEKMYEKSSYHITQLIEMIGEEDAKTLLRILKKTPLYKGDFDEVEDY